MTKCTVFVAIFPLILLVKTINGQHNDGFCNENFKTNSPVLQSQPIRTYTMINNFQDLWNQNGNTIPLQNNVNQNPILMQTNTSPLSSNTQEIDPDLLQQTLQVQQYLQLKNPIQQILPLQQSQYPLQQIETQPALLPIQSQDFLQLQTPIQVQPEQHVTIQQALQAQQPLQTTQLLPTYQPNHDVQPLQQSLQAQQPLQTPQSLSLQHTIQDSFQVPQPVQLHQALGFQQNTPQNALTISENKNPIEMQFMQERNNNLPNTQIRVKWKSSNPPTTIEKRQSTQNSNVQRQQNFINHPVEVVDAAQTFRNKPQEVPSLRYYVAAPQPPLQSPASAITPIIPNYHSVPTIPNYIKTAEETSVASPYNYVIPISDVPLSIPQNTKSIPSIPQSSSILAVSSPPSPQSHFYNQDSKQNSYINQNVGIRYIEQSQHPIVLQGQQTLLAPSQSSVLSPIPISIIQAPSVSSNYGVSPGYPANSVVAPVYTSVKPKSSNLKSILPLIFDLLRAKVGSCSCRNNCPCDCKNNSSDNELEVTSGYSSQRDSRAFPSNGLSVINAVSEHIEGPEFVREPKNCKNISLEISGETLEEEDYDEEIEEDEDS